jgi:low affinity Fe/Cu permease
MPIHKFIGGEFNYWKVFFSATIALFYGSIIVMLAMIFLILICIK